MNTITIIEQTKKEIAIEYSSFFKNEYGGLAAFYSPEDTISILNLGSYGYVNVCRCKVSSFHDAKEFLIKGTPITETEFNEAFAEAVFKISAVEICPTLTRNELLTA